VDVMTRQRSPLYEQNTARGLLEQPNYLPGGTTDYAHLRSQFPLGLLAPTPPGVQDPPPAGPPYLVPPMPRLGFPGVTSWFGRGSELSGAAIQASRRRPPTRPARVRQSRRSSRDNGGVGGLGARYFRR